jgi:hypothetical protein
MMGPGDRPATINRTTQLLSQAFKLAIECGHLRHAPKIRRLSEDNAREGFFDEAQARAVLANLPDDGLRDFVLLAYLCGWRKGSIAKPRWSAVDLKAGEILLPGKFVKNRKPLKMAIEGELRELLERREAARSIEKMAWLKSPNLFFIATGVRLASFVKPGRLLAERRTAQTNFFTISGELAPAILFAADAMSPSRCALGAGGRIRFSNAITFQIATTGAKRCSASKNTVKRSSNKMWSPCASLAKLAASMERFLPVTDLVTFAFWNKKGFRWRSGSLCYLST